MIIKDKLDASSFSDCVEKLQEAVKSIIKNMKGTIMTEHKTGFDKMREIADNFGKCDLNKKLIGVESCDGLSCRECEGKAKKAFNALIDQAESETFMRPRFEDGKPFEFIDETISEDGRVTLRSFVNCATVNPTTWTIRRPKKYIGELIAKFEADKKKNLVDYWGCMNIDCKDCSLFNGKNPKTHYDVACCSVAQGLEIARRKSEIDELVNNAIDWDAFESSQLVVKCTTEEADDEFRQVMHWRGMVWKSGDSLIEEKHFHDEICYYGRNDHVTYSTWDRSFAPTTEWKSVETDK